MGHKAEKSTQTYENEKAVSVNPTFRDDIYFTEDRSSKMDNIDHKIEIQSEEEPQSVSENSQEEN